MTVPAPKWATPNPQREDIDATYAPSAAEFAAFVQAVGTRYSGSFVPHPIGGGTPPKTGGGGGGLPPLPLPGRRRRRGLRQAPPAQETPLPRVDQWEIWNEPNQARC